MSDLIAMQPNLNIPLYLVAPDERRIPRGLETWGYRAGPPQRFRDIEVYRYERR